ncbi:MAG TPA: cupin domain-containing protein [Zeimonas sp.]|nr:cupin domain-containing protein [Zeimonas sp.]
MSATRPLPRSAIEAPPRAAVRSAARWPLGGVSVDQFLRDHWQRRPLLVRGAVPDAPAPLSAGALVELAARDTVESRLVSAAAGRWRLQHGPFEAAAVPPLTRPRWTLLVQGVDLHDDRAHALLARFRFVPDARLDDLMISLASDGGGVGPHVDSYDVFLLQAWGRRRWRIGWPRSRELTPALPLKILARFEPQHEFVLEPGDMLYLPPGWAHDGVAEGPCMTCSIGFRAPSRHEFLSAFLADAADAAGGPDPRFGDAGRPAATRPARLPEDLHGRLARWARDWRPTPAALDDFIGRYLTEPKPQVWFDRPAPLSTKAFTARASRAGLRLDRRTRMAYRRRRVFVNGEAFEAGAVATHWLRRLADARLLDPSSAAQAIADPACSALLHEWHAAGWLRLGSA